MLGWRTTYFLSLLLAANLSASPIAFAVEGGANTEETPKQILRTRIDINSSEISANSRQLADLLKLTPLLKRIQTLSGRANSERFQPHSEDLTANQELSAAIVEADHVIQEANLAVDFTLAEMRAESDVYAEMLSSYTNTRDKRIFFANAVSYITNGVLWAVAEAFNIPTYRHPRLSVPSGILGILAGIIPSLASGYTLYELRGPHKDSEKDPNMLAKLFDCPAPPDEEYPEPVWAFLNAIPPKETENSEISQPSDNAALGQAANGAAGQGYSGAVRLGSSSSNQGGGASNSSQAVAGDNDDNAAQGETQEKPKSRKDQLIDRWVADKNIPAFTDPKEKKQVDIITACNSRKRGLTIAMLNARSSMLQQLSSEVLKIKRMLLELSMAVHGEKRV